ncbi:flagellar hook-basal body protein [Ammoniphilus resinae]|uniref:Flagellar basal-body rod protein FlgG n=1 Tax=Ammoniphilus resinae TaxID=861532 RepID=A0ABS4GMH0_9BACL|nr:flagellar hook-basal body protein [Ammoniphilus resinae]MBP1931454.1 flagellar basal-body rod protein FlgG [Ammoniphilus resinae]
MLRGIQSAVSGMVAQQRKQDALTQNLANLNTPGYKNDQAVMRAFPDMLLARIRDHQDLPQVMNAPSIPGQQQYLGVLQNGVYTQELIPDFSLGTLIETGNEYDVAIADQDLPPITVDGQAVKPAIFFAVQNEQGEVRYTRNGKFTVDASGQLTTSDGLLVLDSLGLPIEMDETGKLPLTDLGLVQVDNPHQLVREGNNTYRYTGANQPQLSAPADLTGFSLQQGFIEGSNVDPAKTMTEMMMTMRSFEAGQKVIQAYDRTLEQLNTIGKLG